VAHHFFFPLQVSLNPDFVQSTEEVSPLAVVMVSVEVWKVGVDTPGVICTDVTSDPDVSSASGTAVLQFIAWAARLHSRAAHAPLPDKWTPDFLHVSITLGASCASSSVMRPCAVPQEEGWACSDQRLAEGR